MTYKDALTQAMTDLASDPRACFCGYGLLAGQQNGTLKGVSQTQIVECPVAENLMTGVAIGLSMKGRLPLVLYERGDFVWNASDAIVNHLAAMTKLSRGEFNPAVILRVVVGNRTKPLFTGPVHTSNPAEALRHLVGFPVIELRDPLEIGREYWRARDRQLDGRSTILCEFKDSY